jgi:predicted DNA-binding protein (UPF0251 family)
MRVLEEVSLGRDELEALRLADLENLSHEETGEMLNVSRATAGRILAGARRKVAHALVHGHAIRVEGGVVETIDGSGRGAGDRGPGRGRRRRRGQGHAS